jgi:hypothetical protein
MLRAARPGRHFLRFCDPAARRKPVVCLSRQTPLGACAKPCFSRSETTTCDRARPFDWPTDSTGGQWQVAPVRYSHVTLRAETTFATAGGCDYSPNLSWRR